MTDDPRHTESDDVSDKPEQDAADGATLKSDSHPVFGSNIQPQEIYHNKIVGAPDPDKPEQASATETVDTHPVFGSNAQPQDVYDEKIVGDPDVSEPII